MHSCAMSLSFPDIAQFAFKVGQTPWSAADALVGLLGLDGAEFLRPAGPGGPAQTRGLPHDFKPIPILGKTKWHCALVRAVSPLLATPCQERSHECERCAQECARHVE